jgi:hypothetical protein
MAPSLLLLWALTGGAISIVIMIRIWLPDPPPDIAGRFAVILVAGIIGGVAGGAVVHTLAAESTHGQSILGAVTASLILSGATALLGGARGKAGR